MSNPGRRRIGGRRRPPGGPLRRPLIGAPGRDWWDDESAEQWWLDDPTEVRLLDDPSQPRPSRRRWIAAAIRRRGRGAGPRRHGPGTASRRRWLDAASRHPWYAAFGLGAGFMVLASGVLLILPKSTPRAMATNCGLVPCAAPMQPPALPNLAPVVSPSATPSVPPTAVPSPAPSMALPAAAPSATAPVVPQIPPSVTIAYTLVVRWDGALVGEFTVTNTGRTAITGWDLSAAFPGDQLQFTWGPIEPAPGSDVVVMASQPNWPTIAPGTSQSGYFLAQGNTIIPASCTFNGVACLNYTGYNNTGYSSW